MKLHYFTSGFFFTAPSVKPPPLQSAKTRMYPPENLDIQQLKEKGNREFQNGNLIEAAKLYSLAIDVGLRMRKDGHELAVLYSNRAECHLKLAMNTQALDDAVESVSHDGHWYKVRDESILCNGLVSSVLEHSPIV